MRTTCLEKYIELELDGKTFEVALALSAELSNPSFDHEFGTEVLPDQVECFILDDIEVETEHLARWELWQVIISRARVVSARNNLSVSFLILPLEEVLDAWNKHKALVKRLTALAEAWIEENHDTLEEEVLERSCEDFD